MRQLVTKILDASTDPSTWVNVLDQFNETMGVSSSCMFTLHNATEFRMDFVFSTSFRKYLPPELIEVLKAGQEESDVIGYQFLTQNPSQVFYDEFTAFGQNRVEDFPKSQVRDYANAHGFCMRTAAALNQRGPWLDAMFCQARTDAEWQGLIQDARCDVLLPIMANSVALGRTLQALRERFSAALSMLDALGLAVFLVDANGCVINHNNQAQDLLSEGDGISISRDRRLALARTDKTAELDTLIAKANGILRGEIATPQTVMTAEKKSLEFDYLISVRPLHDTQNELEPGLKCAFVTIINPSKHSTISADGIAKLTDLTPSEIQVVDLLLTGLRAADIAKRRGVSLNTVKSQLKTIYQKLRVSNQGDVIRIAAATQIPFSKNVNLIPRMGDDRSK